MRAFFQPCLLVIAALFGLCGSAAAQTSPAPSNAAPSDAAPEAKSPLSLGGYVEALYQWNFNNPSNGISNFRGFDNRHNHFTLSNVALDAQMDHDGILGRLALQIGHTPSTYYLAEPSAPGSAGANASGAELWKYLQQAYAGYRFGSGMQVSAGLFLSPIGPEGMVVHENWNWSRSNLFFGLPFYHTGVRVEQPLNARWTLKLGAFNGWNSVVDNNSEKSLAAQLTYTLPEKLALSMLYFAGVERPRDAPEGRAWRHLFDAHATWMVSARLSLLGHFNLGFEPNHFGISSWVAGALYGRFQLIPELFIAARADAFYEKGASNRNGSASSIFWPVPWVASGTATLEFLPHDHVSFRLEYRHDHASGSMFFGGPVTGDGTGESPFLANRSAQNTLTIGATSWF